MFLFGLTAMSNIKTNENLSEIKVVKDKEKVGCATAHTVCNNAHPYDYDLFRLCMERNGC